MVDAMKAALTEALARNADSRHGESTYYMKEHMRVVM